IVRERNKIALYSSAGTTALVQAQCSQNGIQWTYDTYALAHGTAGAVVRNGATKWFIVGADYAFGRQLAADMTSVVQANGGTVLGSVWHPLNNPDFSSYLLTAQASGAQVIAIASAGGDATNAIKQAAEFHLGDGGQQLAAMIFLPQDAHSLGLKATQGIYLTTSFYSDIDDATRAWSKRFTERVGAGPSMLQAGVYSSVAHYLKAVKAAGTKDTAKVMAQMRAMPVEDFMTHGGHIRADGHLMRDMYLAQVKTPAESKGEWDLFKIITRESQCDLKDLVAKLYVCSHSLALIQRRRLTLRVDPPLLKRLLRFGLPTMPAEVSLYLLNFVDRLIIVHYVGLPAAGLYSVGVKFAQAVNVLVRGFQLAWPPLAYSIRDDDEARRTYATVI
ncbi:MAG: ABC transporter substrate-binding protein, partial [Rhodospirillales bacterium]|nr:ABC transporter substrate-binding protein [Rhodospirillales bacterium]